MRILSIIGTRPEAVKMAPVVRALSDKTGIESQVVVTAQHREMLDQILSLFQIKPDVDLDIMTPDQSLSQLTASLFTRLDPVLKELKPDWVLAQGDTSTVMVASLVAYYHRIKFGHVEAGLRTFDKWQPFPEEINRRIAGAVGDLHFAPTEWARENLLREGVPAVKIVVTGNPVIDALNQISSKPVDSVTETLIARLGLEDDPARRLILVTAHRRENFGLPIENICNALLDLVECYGESIKIIYPVHLNPNIRKPVYSILGHHPRILLIEPLDYLPMVQMMKKATLILTDSGGIQEEAPGLGKPVLVLREVTERPEGILAGVVRLVGTDRKKIVSETRRLLEDPVAYRQMSQAVNPYGDGRAAERIVHALLGMTDVKTSNQ